MVDFVRSIFNPEKRANYGIVALLDPEHEQFIKSIWQEIEGEFDVKIPFKNPIPHITHIQAGKINEPQLHKALKNFAENQAPYSIRTAGIGIFTGEHKALYVSVVRNPNLTAIQTTLLSSLAGAVEDFAETHLVNNWMPHITLVVGLSDNDKLAGIVKRLAQRNFAWEFKVRRLALLDMTKDDDSARFQVELSKDKS